MDRLERLVNLVAALLDADRPLSREELRVRVGGYAEETEAFRRNFERDKDVIRQMGMPLVLEPLDIRQPEGPAGYRIPRDRYQLPDPGLADDELAALNLAASAVDIEGAWGRSAATTALWKLAAATGGAAGPAAGAGGLTVGMGGPSAGAGGLAPGAAPAPPGPAPASAAPVAGQPALELPGGERVAVLFGAVAERRQVRFGYHGAARVIDPWRLSFRNGQWYLVGLDHSRGESRTFRLDRIETTPVLVGEPGAFERPPAASAAPPPAWQLGEEDEEIVATVQVDATQAEWAVTTVGGAAVTGRADDGSVTLTLAVTNRSAFRSFVLGFLDHAELLGPPELVDDLISWLEDLHQRAQP